MAHENEGDWGEYRRLILQELQRLHEAIDDVKSQIAALNNLEIASIKAEIAVLKFKAGILGLLAGAIPGLVALIYAAAKG